MTSSSREIIEQIKRLETIATMVDRQDWIPANNAIYDEISRLRKKLRSIINGDVPPERFRNETRVYADM